MKKDTNNELPYPHYIPSYPSGEDDFDNKPHEALAKTLKDLIVDNKYQLDNKMIGLEGEWGSGKTNVIKKLEKEFTKGESGKPKIYHIFTFDVWAHQENISPKLFLTELLEYFIDKKEKEKDIQKQSEREIRYNEIRASLDSKNKTTKIQKHIHVESFLVPLILIPIVSYICLIIHPYLPSWAHNKGIYVKGVLLFLSISLFLKCELELYRYESQIYNKSNNQIKRIWHCLWYGIKQLFLIFIEKNENSTLHEEILEDFPSVSRFQSKFKEIIDTLDSTEECLIVIFDNMDRLNSRDKLLLIWSSIFTFFSDFGKGTNNVWTIITYDKQHLTSLFNINTTKSSQNKDSENIKNLEDDNVILQEFLSKTFSTSFTVSTPIASNWKQYLICKLKQAFGDKLQENDAETLALLFQYSNEFDKIKPRQMIAYVNDLVSLYIQHKSKNIEIPYLGLFLLHKDEINRHPLEEIIEHKDCDGIEFLFDNEDNNITKALAALYYNMPIKNVEEVLINKLIDIHIEEKDQSKFDQLSYICKSNKSNLSYIHQYLQDNIIDKKFDSQKYYVFIINIEALFSESSNNVNNSLLDKCWGSFKIALSNVNYSVSKTDFYESVICNAPLDIANFLTKHLLSQTEHNLKEYCLVLAIFYKIKIDKRGDLKIENKEIRMSIIDIKLLIDSLYKEKILTLKGSPDDYKFYENLKIKIQGVEQLGNNDHLNIKLNPIDYFIAQFYQRYQ